MKVILSENHCLVSHNPELDYGGLKDQKEMDKNSTIGEYFTGKEGRCESLKKYPCQKYDFYMVLLIHYTILSWLIFNLAKV